MEIAKENTETSSGLVATFVVDGRYYGLETDVVQEVVRVGEITPVHHSPDFIVGIMNLRGRIITVVDLGQKLVRADRKIDNHTRIFIADWDQESVGLMVNKVGEVVAFDQENLVPPPENLPVAQAGMLKGVFHSGNILIGLLNLSVILDENRFSEDKSVGI